MIQSKINDIVKAMFLYSGCIGGYFRLCVQSSRSVRENECRMAQSGFGSTTASTRHRERGKVNKNIKFDNLYKTIPEPWQNKIASST